MDFNSVEVVTVLVVLFCFAGISRDQKKKNIFIDHKLSKRLFQPLKSNCSSTGLGHDADTEERMVGDHGWMAGTCSCEIR